MFSPNLSQIEYSGQILQCLYLKMLNMDLRTYCTGIFSLGSLNFWVGTSGQ